MSAGASEGRAYIPAATYHWLLPLYDVFARLAGSEAAHRQLVDQAHVEPGHRVLEIGCGTGTLTLLVKQLYPRAEVVGLDPDPRALARAERKAQKRGLAVRLDRGFADELPYADASFDRMLSAFMLHHLALDEKRKTLREAWRVLRGDGTFHALDFAGAGHHGLIAHLFSRAHLEHGHPVPDLLREAGFADVRETAQRPTMFGRVGYWRAAR
jgi:ubiquinone/menaquinone biosynthesis C-methylase UbiE